MVNTFLPFPDYDKTAESLDYRRLGKQRVEALQILKVNLGLTQGWKNHPAAVMWRGHEGALFKYLVAICKRWTSLGYKDTVLEKATEIVVQADLDPESYSKPKWLGNRRFHKSHQSNLKRKDPVHYQFNVPDDLPYVWPGEDTK
jgi:Pyrimidine dimer DNA glycosylase